jgi:putative Ca2+/H+ antiporter (TMEM165/GDT1 family)
MIYLCPLLRNINRILEYIFLGDNMNFIYPFIIAFLLIFVSELGDKTQLLVLSFSSKLKASTILLGVGLGSLLSHGTAIVFGSFLGNIENLTFQYALKIITYLSFIIFGIITLIKSNKTEKDSKDHTKKNLKSNLSYVFFIALTIAIGELGDKTFLASIGLGIEYSLHKVSLICGTIAGMIISDLMAIIFGKALSHKIPENIMQKLSGILFLIFGFLGILNFIF